MITQLLRISTTPIKYEMEIERAKLEYSQDFMPKGTFDTEPAKLALKTSNAKVLVNTYEARKSLGLFNSVDRAKYDAEKGRASISKTTRMYVDIGNEMTRIDQGVTIADIFAEKVLGDQPILFTAFLPSTGADISWIPHEIQMDFSMPEVSYEWEIMRNILNYVPGSIRMTILQQPSIEIEYMGGAMYFPPSANPEHEALEG